MIEFTAALATDFPMYKTLPGLSAGLGGTFGIGLLPFERGGLSFGVNSTWHKMNADTGATYIIRGESQRMSVFIQGQYRFMTIGVYGFNSYIAAAYNSINGGDKNGSYLNYGVNSEDIGYSGYGILFGLGVSRPFAENYSLYLSGKYSLLDYTKHQYPAFISPDSDNSRKGSSLIINFGVLYQVDFASF